jgi:hypothetical protein
MGTRIGRRQVVGTVGTLGLTALAIGAMGVAEAWLGDLVAFLWMVATFLTPWLIGIALGAHGVGTQGRLIGAAISALVVVAPAGIYALAASPDLDEIQLPLLWAYFVPLALALGAIALPVGARVLDAKKAKS